LIHPYVERGECRKLKQRRKGPYLIVDRSDDGLLYKLRHCKTGKKQRSLIHSKRLKKFNEDRDLFYTKKFVLPDTSSQTVQMDAQPKTTNLGDESFEIDKLSYWSKKVKKVIFLVHWKDCSKSRKPEENISDFAKSQYFVALKQRRKQRRRSLVNPKKK